MVSLAWTALTTDFTAGVAFFLLMIGTMFWAAKLFLSSLRMTNLLASIDGSVVNRSTAST